MAYHLHHIIQFFNCLNEKLYIELHKKDIEPVSVTELRAISFAVQYPTGDGGTFDTPIISCEAKLTLYLETTDNEDFDDFIVTFADEWKMVVYNEAQNVFVGFLTPGEGRAELQDKPYEITLSAVDGLGLLKGVLLTKDDGTNFTGVNLIIDYVIAILNKTGLGLDLRLISNIIEESMEDRTQNEQADTFNQTGLHARTFLQNPTVFYDCYTCLERILSEYFCLYQWFGKWVILRIGELQANVGAKVWYSEYNSSGVITSAEQSLVNPGAVGRDRLLHPAELTQYISSNFAIKSAKYTYNYSAWPELPTNNKFERGTEFESGNATDDEDFDNDGNTSEIIGTYKKFTIDSWEQGVVDVFDLPNPSMSPVSNKYYRRSIYNDFGTEIDRQIIAETYNNSDIDEAFWLRSEGIPVNKGDKIKVSLQKRFDNDFSGSGSTFTIPATVYIVKSDNSVAYYLNNNVGGIAQSTGKWIQAVNLAGQLIMDYSANQDTREWNTLSVDSLAIPFDGTLYYALRSNGPISNTGALQHYKDINLEYYPYMAGGYVPVKADFAKTSQDDRYKDVIEEDVYISDSQKKVLQGALYRENLTDLTTTTWHRYNVVEQRHFKELGELARFNNNYRRMWKIEGQFDGLKFAPADDMTRIEPLSFHRHFSFPDSSKLNGHYFALVPPLTLNYSEGRADMNFIEVLQDGSEDGNSTGDDHIPIQYVFE